MSTRTKELTKHQKRIIDALANDYENIEQVRELIGSDISSERLNDDLWTLIQEGYVACFSSTATAMQPVRHPQRQGLNAYWFALTKRGEQLLSSLSLR